MSQHHDKEELREEELTEEAQNEGDIFEEQEHEIAEDE